MKTIYWVSTSLVTFAVLLSAFTYIFHKGTIDGIRELGFPDFFRIQLAILKIIAVVALLIPQTPLQIKEWAYAGIGLFFITAIVAHISHKDPIFLSLISVCILVLLAISNIYMHKLTGL